MKTTSLLISVLLFPFLNIAQNQKLAKQIDKTFKQIKKDTLLASECECSNESFNMFLQSSKGKGYIIDSAGWRNHIVNNEPFVLYYHKHAAFSSYPVVNITYEAASAYCEWLTEEYNKTPKRKYKKVIIKLPEVEDWEYAASSGDKNKIFPWKGIYLKNSKGKLLANFAPVYDGNVYRKNVLNLTQPTVDSNQVLSCHSYGEFKFSLYTSPCREKFFYKTPTGLYHVAGNVSEFTIDRNIVKGGNFNSPGGYLKVYNNLQEFDNPHKGNAFIGFRPFLYVIEK